MKTVILLLSFVVSVTKAAPLYGADGGYRGFASYVPFKNHVSRASLNSHDSIDTSAGSPDIIRRPSKQETVSSTYQPESVPKKYDVLDYTPEQKHGYRGNAISEDNEAAPYHHATIYGQSNGGYKIADTYQNQPLDNSYSGNEHEDYQISEPQPYEYGYALKDEHGNTQHKHETSDGHGNVKGTYGFTDEHGIYRSVEYVAGKDGFKASIKTNEPGTKSQNPADVHLESESSEE